MNTSKLEVRLACVADEGFLIWGEVRVGVGLNPLFQSSQKLVRSELRVLASLRVPACESRCEP